MEKYILDTCTWIEYFHERNGVKERVDEKDIDQIFASEVTLAELTYAEIYFYFVFLCRSTCTWVELLFVMLLQKSRKLQGFRVIFVVVTSQGVCLPVSPGSVPLQEGVFSVSFGYIQPNYFVVKESCFLANQS